MRRPGTGCRRALWWRLPAGLAALVVVVWVVYLDRVPHYDVVVFLRAGWAVRHGLDPYPAPGSSEVYSGSSFVYPYVVAWLFAPLSALPEAAAASVFVALSILAVLAGCRLLGIRELRGYALVLVMSCTIVGLQVGSLNALLFLAVAALWRWRDRSIAAAVLLTAAVVSKVFLAPLWLWLLLTRRVRAAGRALGLTGVVLGLGWVLGPLSVDGYGSLLSSLGVHEAASGLGVTGLLMNAGLDARHAQLAARIAAAGVIGVSYHRARAVGNENVLYTGCLVAALTASPVVWTHYMLLLVVPLLAARRRPGAYAPLAIAAICSWLVVTPHRSGVTAVALGAAALALLGGPALLRATILRLRRLSSSVAWDGRAGRWLTLAGCLAGTFLLVRHLAADRGRAGPVVGAYCAQLALLAVFARAWGAPGLGARAAGTPLVRADPVSMTTVSAAGPDETGAAARAARG